jgi:hypothetical protein
MEVNRPKCIVEGCKRKADKLYPAKRDGTYSFGLRCSIHRREHYGMKKYVGGRALSKEILDMSNQPCSRCGWDKSYCDRHRIVSGEEGGKYIEGNVIPLCPNCHRELHDNKVAPT